MALKRLTLSYLLDPEFEFWIFGRWNGKGIVQVRYAGNFVEELRLPRVRWAVLTTLAQRANACQAGPPERAFMTAREILDRLRNRKVLQTSNPGRVVRLIHELRKKLNKAKARKLQKAWGPGPREWGKRVIETHPLGYRLSLNPDNIHIQILDDGSAVPAPKSASFTRSIDSRRPWSAFTGPPRQ